MFQFQYAMATGSLQMDNAVISWNAISEVRVYSSNFSALFISAASHSHI